MICDREISELSAELSRKKELEVLNNHIKELQADVQKKEKENTL